MVLVRSCSEYNDLRNPHNIAEFFVMKKYRKKELEKLLPRRYLTDLLEVERFIFYNI